MTVDRWMIGPDRCLGRIANRLAASWSDVVDGAVWHGEFHLGTSSLKGDRLRDHWPAIHREAMEWDAWMAAADGEVQLLKRQVTVHRSPQRLPATLVLPTVEAAARLVGDGWPERLARGRARRATMLDLLPDRGSEIAGLVRAVDDWSDVDFELACRAAVWFRAEPESGLTARQVPVEGMGTKWLAGRQSVVRRMAGLDDLGLVRGRPHRLHLTYLDPEHLAARGRRHDVFTVGDEPTLAYRPSVVVLSENRDTAQLFEPIPGGIAVEGNETAREVLAEIDWIRRAEHVFWWGDMDADGLEILDGLRAAGKASGIVVRSLFMDMASWRRWQRYGVDHDHRGAPLTSRPARAVLHLEAGERDLYDALCSPAWEGHRRIEQERIPLAEAAGVVRSAVTRVMP